MRSCRIVEAPTAPTLAEPSTPCIAAAAGINRNNSNVQRLIIQQKVGILFTIVWRRNTSESDYKLNIQEADYIFKGPIIYSRGR